MNAIAFVQIRKELGRLSSIGVATAGYKPWDFPSAIAGQASAIPILLFPVWIEFGSGLHDIIDKIVLIGTLLLIVLAVLAVVFVAGRAHALNATWGLVVAVLPLIGLVQFWYATFYRPAHEGPRVNVVAKLDPVGRHGDVTRMRGTVALENVGVGQLDVIGAVYTVTGHDVPAARHLDQDDASAALKDTARVEWRENEEYRGLLKVGRLIRHGGHLTPGQKNETSFVFDAENDSQEKVRLTVFLYLIVHGADSLEGFTRCGKGDFVKPDVCLEVRLPFESIIRDLLGDRPVARVKFRQPNGGSVPVPLQEVEFFPKGPGVGRSAKDVQSIEPYRLSRGVTTSVEYPLNP